MNMTCGCVRAETAASTEFWWHWGAIILIPIRKQVKGGEKPDYGNWVSSKLVYLLGGMTLIFLVMSLVLPLFMIGAVLLFLSFLCFWYAHYKFSPPGGNIQVKIRDLVLDHIDWNGEGRAIDIGCGNGALTIELAQKYLKSSVVGIDYWGRLWDYSRHACEKNAEIERVASRVTFHRASAAALPFEDECFNLAVSNFAFHAVKDAGNKREVIKEALRVVKKGGSFAFQDLFPARRLYGDVDDLLETIRGWGIERVHFVDTTNSDFIPKLLKLPFMVGSIGIIYGTK